MSSSAQGGAEDTLVIERMYPHAQEKVWRAISDGELLAQWLMKNDFEPTVGRRFQFRSQPMPEWDGVIESEVLLMEPPNRLSYRWNALGLDSVVEFTLRPVEGGTLLRMEQRGFAPEQRRAYGGAKYGWQQFLGSLDRVLGGLA